jgi:signal transduction histidine kinase
VALSLEILPAWWNTRLFRAVCVVISLALVWALYQLRLRQLAKQFNARLEERISERTRIARELHDSLLQGFQGLMFRLQAVRDQLPGRPREAMKALDIALERGDKVIVEARDTVTDLRQSIVGDGEIAEALTALNEELTVLSGNHGAPCMRVLVEGKQRALNPMVRDEIYRIAREALRNAFQHAKAQKIETQITYGDSEFVLYVRDDGSGIVPEVVNQRARTGHWGLSGMRERAKSFGGKLEVWSEHRAGTEIALIVPASVAYSASDFGRRFWLWRRKPEASKWARGLR